MFSLYLSIDGLKEKTTRCLKKSDKKGQGDAHSDAVKWELRTKNGQVTLPFLLVALRKKGQFAFSIEGAYLIYEKTPKYKRV